MAGYPPNVPPTPPPGWDPRDQARAQRQYWRDQARAQRAAWRVQRDQMRWQMRGLRRGSILGPVLLISIGILFLLLESGHLDRHNFWGWYGHWWPLLLVGAGLIVLAEWALDQYAMRDPQAPHYRRSMGAGVFFLLLFVVVTGGLASSGLSLHRPADAFFFKGFGMDEDSLDQLLGDKHESDQNADYALAAGSSLTVFNPRGDVTVSGTSDDGRVHVAIHKQVYARTDSDAENRAQQLAPSTTNDAGGLTLNMPAMDGARSDLVITLPGTTPTNVRVDRGDIHASSVKAPVTATANHGDIELSAISGPVTAHINNSHSSLTARNVDGGVNIQGHAEDVTLIDISGAVSLNGDFYGTTHLEHINGAVHFHTSRSDMQLGRLDGESELSAHSISAEQALGPVVLSTSNRDVTLERVAGDISVTNKNGTVELTAAPALGNVTVENRNGSIKTTLPEKAGFQIQAGATNGEIESEFQLSTWGSENNKNLNGTVGGGGPMVRLTTSNGDISINKGDVQPIPPTAPAPPKITMTPQPSAAPKPPKPPKPPAQPAP